MTQLSIIIVNYNTKALTEQTIQAVFDTTHKTEYEIIVADNSSDKTLAYASGDPRVKVIEDVENRGFGYACNVGAAMARGRYVLFLNSDTVMQEGTLDKCVAYMDENADIGCLGIRTLLRDGTLDHGCKRGFPTPMNSFCYVTHLDRLFPKSRLAGGYRMSYIDEHETADVDSVSGAFMLMPKALFDKSGGFDESIFMYGEDIDLCYRVKLMGYRVVYYAEGLMIHLKGQSGLNTKNTVVIRHFRDGIKRFYDKYYIDKYNFLVTFLMHTAIDLRYYVALIRARF
ncbi:MAG: glycosyltransferase family 2 protein [Firmicutes bacterium]|nr:glycosyltransferase family 2 protein [Bacillota bacterium]